MWALFGRAEWLMGTISHLNLEYAFLPLDTAWLWWQTGIHKECILVLKTAGWSAMELYKTYVYKSANTHIQGVKVWLLSKNK